MTRIVVSEAENVFFFSFVVVVFYISFLYNEISFEFCEKFTGHF